MRTHPAKRCMMHAPPSAFVKRPRQVSRTRILLRMALAPQPEDAEPKDLLGRWLAHHEEQGPDEPPHEDSSEAVSHAEPTKAPPPAPRAQGSRKLPAALVASSAVEGDPVIGARLEAPSTFGARRAATHGANAALAEGDREPPPGWEPIVMRSARKKAESQKGSASERPGRLARLKARLVDPLEPVESVDSVTEADPDLVRQTVVVDPAQRAATTALASQPTTDPAAAPPAPPMRSVEETIQAALA